MGYNSISLTVKKGKAQINYTATRPDTTGLGGNWETGGILYDVINIDNHIVLCNPFNSTPVAVFDNQSQLQEFIKKKTGLSLM